MPPDPPVTRAFFLFKSAITASPHSWRLRLSVWSPIVQCNVRIPTMPLQHISRLDRSLLPTLFALLEERHITRAAKRCFLSQPAMSRALERLRKMFGDELLVRVGSSYERTARGERLLRELESLLPRLDLLF